MRLWACLEIMVLPLIFIGCKPASEETGSALNSESFSEHTLPMVHFSDPDEQGLMNVFWSNFRNNQQIGKGSSFEDCYRKGSFQVKGNKLQICRLERARKDPDGCRIAQDYCPVYTKKDLVPFIQAADRVLKEMLIKIGAPAEHVKVVKFFVDKTRNVNNAYTGYFWNGYTKIPVIVIEKGKIFAAKDDSELFGTLSHEWGHRDRYSKKGPDSPYARKKQIRNSCGDNVRDCAIKISKVSREEELIADRFVPLFAQQAAAKKLFNPFEYVNFFRSKKNYPDKLCSSHPPPHYRAKLLEQRLAGNRDQFESIPASVSYLSRLIEAMGCKGKSVDTCS